MKLIFLDIDGVLNRHEYNSLAKSSPIFSEIMGRLNKITDSTGAQVVISSAWRYMIHGKAMTLLGFQYMLQTHGAHFTLAGYIKKDEDCVHCGTMNSPGTLKCIKCIKCGKESQRGELISDWIKLNNHIDKYVVIDDLDLGISGLHPFVKTNGKIGLQEKDVNKAIRILK